MAPTVSIVIPLYNAASYIGQAIAAIRAQTFTDWELIVVDDGSRDDSASAAERAAKEQGILSDRFTLIRQANAGEPAARNAGIAVARGEWIANTDADDWWEPTKLQRQLELVTDEIVLVHTAVITHEADGSIVPLEMTGSARRVGRCTAALLEPASICHPSILVRHETLRQIGGYDPSFRQACDIDLYFRLSAIGSFAFVPEYLTHYRIHPGQLSRSPMDQIRYHHRAVRKFFDQHPEYHQILGESVMKSALARHVATKLESLYWRRELQHFRDLLRYAREQDLDSPEIRTWATKGYWPNWTIRLRDRLTSSARAR